MLLLNRAWSVLGFYSAQIPGIHQPVLCCQKLTLPRISGLAPLSYSASPLTAKESLQQYSQRTQRYRATSTGLNPTDAMKCLDVPDGFCEMDFWGTKAEHLLVSASAADEGYPLARL